MRHNPYEIIKMFEETIADYTGSKYAVAIDNCTDAIFLCCEYLSVGEVTIPKKTYLSVPQSITQAGGRVKFENISWKGIYQLKPYPIYDAARRFTSNMYIPNSIMCLSFHPKKILKMNKGGMILTDSEDAYKWFKKARHEGRNEIPYAEDNIASYGYNMYMNPVDAAQGLWLMSAMPEINDDSKEDYRDLTTNNLWKE